MLRGVCPASLMYKSLKGRSNFLRDTTKVAHEKWYLADILSNTFYSFFFFHLLFPCFIWQSGMCGWGMKETSVSPCQKIGLFLFFKFIWLAWNHWILTTITINTVLLQIEPPPQKKTKQRNKNKFCSVNLTTLSHNPQKNIIPELNCD